MTLHNILPRITHHGFIFIALLAAIFLSSCSNEPDASSSTRNQNQADPPSQYFVHTNKESLKIVFLGDAEPKPNPEFPNMAEAVRQINEMHDEDPFDLAIGVGDIAHKGTVVQYEQATAVLETLVPEFYPIMGNEERESTVERYLQYISQWNSPVTSLRYTVEFDPMAFLFASPDEGRDFNDQTAQWIANEIQRLAPKPVALVVHAAQTGAYPEHPEKGVTNSLFKEIVLTQPNLSMIISGDLHMDMDRTNHSKMLDGIHYLHIPALERTKIPDETNHRPMFRVMRVDENGSVAVETYALDNPGKALQEHIYTFVLQTE